MIFLNSLNSINSLRSNARDLTNKMFYTQSNAKLLNQLTKQEKKLLIKAYNKSYELFQLICELDEKIQQRKNTKKYRK